MQKHVLIIITILSIIGGFSLWAYHAMINIRPHGKGAKLNMNDQSTIEDLKGRLKGHIIILAEEIGPRNVFIPHQLNATADYIRAFWRETGYEVKSQDFQVHKTLCRNIFIEIPGRSDPDEILVVGAHYDTVSNSPGANDNGSGVAALLEISRLFKPELPHSTIRFVAFTNEEPPFFKTGSMGSRVYAEECRRRGDHIIGMVCLETIGYYRDQRKTQRYPFPLSLFYPDKGNFVAVVGNLASKSLVLTFTEHFMEEMDFPVECGALFGFIPGIDWSDHWSFWRSGYPAIMITDTALYRYPYYHSSQDTPDKIDFHSLAKVTYGTFRALQRMAAGDINPLDLNIHRAVFRSL